MKTRDFFFCPFCQKRLKLGNIEGRQRKKCPQCGWVHYKNPYPCSAALVLNKKGEILLVKRGVKPGLGKWALPSGFIEMDETPEKACLRELKEETGLNGNIVELFGVYSQKSLTYQNVIIITFSVKATGKPQPGSDSLKAEFFPLENLPEVAFVSHKKAIADAARILLK